MIVAKLSFIGRLVTFSNPASALRSVQSNWGISSVSDSDVNGLAAYKFVWASSALVFTGDGSLSESIVLGKSDGIPRHFVVTDPSGATAVEVKATSIDLLSEIDDLDFSYSPAPDLAIIEDGGLMDVFGAVMGAIASTPTDPDAKKAKETPRQGDRFVDPDGK